MAVSAAPRKDRKAATHPGKGPDGSPAPHLREPPEKTLRQDGHAPRMTVWRLEIYICGGFNGMECLQTAEYYTPETNQWTMITPMNSRRSGIGVIACAGHIFAVGGFDGNRRLHTAEAFNPETDLWMNVAPMITTRSNFGIEVLENRLFVVGGFNGYTTCYNVECYDTTADEWSEVCDMEVFRSALSCCVISGLPNMVDYMVPRDALPLLPVEEEEEEMESGDSS